MNSNKSLRITIKKEDNTESSGFDNIIPFLHEYRRIIITMEGFKRGEVLEAIRPLTTRNISTTLIVYNGKHEDYDDHGKRWLTEDV